MCLELPVASSKYIVLLFLLLLLLLLHTLGRARANSYLFSRHDITPTRRPPQLSLLLFPVRKTYFPESALLHKRYRGDFITLLLRQLYNMYIGNVMYVHNNVIRRWSLFIARPTGSIRLIIIIIIIIIVRLVPIIIIWI